MVDIDSIRKLIEMMVENEMTEISLRNGDEEISLKRPDSKSQIMMTAQHPAGMIPHMQPQPVLPHPPAAAAPAEPAQAVPKEDENLLTIASPMVGTFYMAPSPDADPFIKVGDEVQPDTVVCIVEAMKVFNEIKAEVHGVITKILVSDREPVEFGQALFGLRPA